MAWYDPRDWSEDDIIRGGLAVGTGGLSEAPGVGGTIREFADDALGRGGKVPGLPDYGAVWNDVKKRYEMPQGMIAQDRATTQADRDRILNWPGSTPIRDTTPIRVGPQSYHDVVTPTETQAHTAGAVERYTPALIGQARDVQMPNMAPVERAVAQGFDAANLGRAAQAGPVQVGKTVIDQGAAGANIGNQQGAIGALQQAAAGKAPSAAEAQLKQGLAEVAQQQLGAAAAARGSERAGARREAMLAIGEGGFKADAAAAALRADEMAKARDALVGATAGARQQDIGLATSQATIEQQTRGLQAEIDRALAMGNVEEANRLTAQQGQLTQGAREFGAGAANRASEVNAAAGNARAVDDATLRAKIAEGNTEREQGVLTHQADLNTAASAAGTAAANARASETAGILNDHDARDRDRAIALGNANANRGIDVDTRNYDRDVLVGTTNNAQGVARDTAESGRQRDDFAATTAGLAGTRASNATSTGQDAAMVAGLNDSQLAILAAQGNQAAMVEQSRRRAQEGALALGGKIVGAAAGNPAALASGGGGGADFGPNNAPSTYGGNTVAF